jgi:hypothetical protein
VIVIGCIIQVQLMISELISALIAERREINGYEK